ncbi:MAG: ERF family protein [Chloroflexi bacterium]|nr:ERF family protein [Chloroflexota bacterium]
MSHTSEYASLGNSNEAPHSDLLENELLDAIASADEANSESIAAPARDVIACKIASIVDGMDGIQRNDNGRYPAHSIDQVVSAVSPLVSAAGLRIKTEVLDIEPFSVLANMPFWRESNGRQEQYTRDVHLFRMKLLFTVINGATGECDRHQWTHVFEMGRSEQDQDCGAAVSYGTKDFLKRQFMIADDSDDPDFKGGGSQRVNPQTLDGQLVPVISIEPNTRKRSERSPGWFAKDESGRISIALWESLFKTIDMLLRWNSGTMLKILGENDDRHRFSAPLILRVKANQHGLSLAADGQLNTLENPAVADQFMQIARNIIPGLSAEQAAEFLDVAQLADFPADMGTALQIIQTARCYEGDANGEGDPLRAAHGLPSDAFGDF